MKALSLTQPWATAMAMLLKQWETRSWATGFRGEFFIHAAKGFPGWAKETACEARRLFDTPQIIDLPLGEIVAVASLADCQKTEVIAPSLSPREIYFGDYAPGRYAFKAENVRALPYPIPCTGALSFWTVPPEIAAQVLSQLERYEERAAIMEEGAKLDRAEAERLAAEEIRRIAAREFSQRRTA